MAEIDRRGTPSFVLSPGAAREGAGGFVGGVTGFSRLILPVAFSLVIAFAAIVTVLIFGARENDETSAKSQQHHLRTALSEQARVIHAGNRDYAWWDELHRQIEPVPNIPLLETYFGVDVPTAFGVTHVLVLKPDGGLIYGIGKGRTPLESGFAGALVGSIQPLVDAAQAMSYTQPDSLDGFIVLANTPYILSIMRLTPEQTPPESEQKIQRPLLVFIKKLDDEAVRNIGKAYLLDDLKFVTGAPPEGSLAIEMVNPEGEAAGCFTWAPKRPGRDLLLKVTPIVGIAILAVAALFVIFWNRAQVLISGYNASMRALHEEKHRTELASRAKSDFLASMSHEFRTPLNAILGFSQFLTLRNSMPEHINVTDAAEAIQRSGRHLLQLVDEILDLARVEEGRLPANMERIDIASALTDATVMVLPIADKHRVNLYVDTPPAGAFMVYADHVKVNQVLVNLMSNAIKYNHAEGRVDVRVSRPTDEIVRVDVVDTGIGIRAEDQQRLFQPFVRLNPATFAAGGAGIGLALSRSLVDLMGGKIGFESDVGKGSTFWVELRAVREAGVAT